VAYTGRSGTSLSKKTHNGTNCKQLQDIWFLLHINLRLMMKFTNFLNKGRNCCTKLFLVQRQQGIAGCKWRLEILMVHSFVNPSEISRVWELKEHNGTEVEDSSPHFKELSSQHQAKELWKACQKYTPCFENLSCRARIKMHCLLSNFNWFLDKFCSMNDSK